MKKLNRYDIATGKKRSEENFEEYIEKNVKRLGCINKKQCVFGVCLIGKNCRCYDCKHINCLEVPHDPCQRSFEEGWDIEKGLIEE